MESVSVDPPISAASAAYNAMLRAKARHGGEFPAPRVLGDDDMGAQVLD